MSLLLMLLQLYNVLRGVGKPYVESLYSWSDLAPVPLYGSNWGHEIADFVLFPYTSFIIAFTAFNVLRGI